jgi:hypothetical protein
MQNLASPKNSLAQIQNLRPASQFADSSRSIFPSNIKRLNDFVDGGLEAGSIAEWGLPFGQGGRLLPASFAAAVSSCPRNPRMVLWISCKPGLQIYPPAWAALGVNLTSFRVAHSADPFHELQAVFLSPVFSMIVIDSPRQADNDVLAFLARQARLNQQLMFVLRDQLLSSGNGNVWARYRLNSWQESQNGRHCLQVIRGYSPRQISFDAAARQIHENFPFSGRKIVGGDL